LSQDVSLKLASALPTWSPEPAASGASEQPDWATRSSLQRNKTRRLLAVTVQGSTMLQCMYDGIPPLDLSLMTFTASFVWQMW